MWHLKDIHLNNSIRSIIVYGWAHMSMHFGSTYQYIKVHIEYTHLVLLL